MVATVEEIQEMNYNQLKEECKKEGLSMKGKTEVLRNRLEKHVEEAARAKKRQKRCPSDDLICPITLELPYDPVMAEDGRVSVQ